MDTRGHIQGKPWQEVRENPISINKPWAKPQDPTWTIKAKQGWRHGSEMVRFTTVYFLFPHGHQDSSANIGPQLLPDLTLPFLS
jgi:hypothetical protein